jgi:hypothetical protein
MTNTSISMVKPDVLDENMQTINSYLRDSYTHVKTHLQHGISYFRSEVHEMYNQVESCFNNMLLPVNNFLKDFTQIDTDFQKESINAPENKSTSSVVPIEIALLSPMEENY